MTHTLLSDLISRQAAGTAITLRYIIDLVRDDLDQDFKALSEWAVTSDICTKTEWKQAIARAKRDRRLIEALGAVPATALEFIELYATAKRATIKFNGRVIMDDPETGKQTTTEMSRFARLCRLADVTLGLDYGAQVITDACDEFIYRARAKRRPAIMASLLHSAASSFDWRALAEATCTDDPDYAAALMQHFIWQVKRKALGLPIERHLMLIFGGPQEIGKSTFAKMLFSPVAELSRTANFKQITDERIIEIWSASVIFMDEMSFASKADADELKDVITAATLDRRPMRSNAMDTVDQMATLIGTTNKPLEMLIRDTTGNRRFGYLVYSATPDFATINGADWAAAWQTVDENAASPLVPFLPKLKEHQAASRVLSVVEQWIGTIDARCASDFGQAAGANNGPLRREYLFERFRQWQDDACVAQRERLDMAGFGHELKRLSEMTTDPVFTFKKTKSFNGYVFNRAALGDLDEPTDARGNPALSLITGGAR